MVEETAASYSWKIPASHHAEFSSDPSEKHRTVDFQSSLGKDISGDFFTTAMIAEEQFRQIAGEDLSVDPMAALLGMNVTLRREVHQERARMNEAVVSQHTEDIESPKSRLMKRIKKSQNYAKLWKISKSKTKN